jgi:hypothetical protein
MQAPALSSIPKRLSWIEPKGFRNAEHKGLWRSPLRIAGLTLAAALVLICVGIWLDLGSEAAAKVLIAAGGIAIVCGVVWIGVRFSRIRVKVTNKAIVWDLIDSPTVYRFSKIDHCEIGRTSVGREMVAVLVVVLKNGDTEAFGIASWVSTEILRAMLEERGVRVVMPSDGGLGESVRCQSEN